MKSDIVGVVINKLTKYEDFRGWLVEIYREDEIIPEYFPVMSYISMTKSGESRGPHEHREQTDMFCFLGNSEFRLYLWDNRPESKTYKKSEIFTFAKGEMFSIIVPPGVVHGYKNIGNADGLIINSPNRLHAGKGRKEEVDVIRYENDSKSNFLFED